jgi:hypothetical protein
VPGDDTPLRPPPQILVPTDELDDAQHMANDLGLQLQAAAEEDDQEMVDAS